MDTHPNTNRRSPAHRFAQVVGWGAITSAIALPVFAWLSGSGDLMHAALLSLGLVPAAIFLVTRPQPRVGRSAVLAALLLPLGAQAVVSGAIPIVDSGYRPSPRALYLGALVLLVGAAHAWLAWSAADPKRAQAGARLTAMAIWIGCGVLAISTVATYRDLDYVDPLAMSLDGNELRVEVPFQGGCANQHMTVETRPRGFDVLEVLVYNHAGFRCAAGCLSDWRAMCTETLYHQLPPQPAGMKAVAAPRPDRAIAMLPVIVVGGAILGGTFWFAPRDRERSDSE